MTSPDTNSNPWLPLFKMDDGCEVSMFSNGTLSWNEGSGPFLIFNESETLRFLQWIDNRPSLRSIPVTPPVPASETARTCVLCGAPMIEKQMDTMGPFAEDQYRQTCHCVHNVANLSDALGHAKRDLTAALARAERAEGDRGVFACEVADLRTQLTAATARLAEVERENSEYATTIWRVWQAFGINTCKDAKGKHVSELIAALRAALAEAKAERDKARKRISAYATELSSVRKQKDQAQQLYEIGAQEKVRSIVDPIELATLRARATRWQSVAEGLAGVMADFGYHGTRHDTHPTMRGDDSKDLVVLRGMLQSADKYIRDTATAAMKPFTLAAEEGK